MKKKINAPETPLCTNIIRLQAYLLSPDEAVLFDWFVVKQIAFKYKSFHYSQSRIEEETRIKRTRQEYIINLFSDLGFLDQEVKLNPVIRSKVRYFYVNFQVLGQKDVLNKIIREDHALFKDFGSYLNYHTGMQLQNLEAAAEKEDVPDKKVSDRIYRLFEETYEERRVMYNEGELTDGDEPERIKTPVQFPKNKAINKKILRLSELYNDTTIKGAFIAYVDAVFKEHEVPYSILDYFLSYSDTKGGFGIFEYYLNAFTRSYSAPRW